MPSNPSGIFLLLLLLLSNCGPLDGLYQPHRDRLRPGGLVASGRGCGGRRPGSSRGQGQDEGKEDWEEERQVASLLEEKIIRKVSMKRWLEERHKFFPTPSAVERLKVEEGEALRDKVLAQEGWLPSRQMAKFTRPQRTRWEETAKRQSAHDDMQRPDPLDDLIVEPFPGYNPAWSGVSELRGGCGEGRTGTRVVDKPQTRRKWRQFIDSLCEVEFEREGKLCQLSLSGLLLDCILASQILFLVQILVDMVVAVPALKLVTQVLFPPLLPSLSEFPHVAGMSIMIAHWGMRLAKTVLAAIFAGHLIAYSAFHGVAFFTLPTVPVLYTCVSSLWTSISIIYRMLEDPRFKDSISFNGIALRLLTCEIPGLVLFFWAACSHKDSSRLSWSDMLPTAWRQHLEAQLSDPFQQTVNSDDDAATPRREQTARQTIQAKRRLEQEMLTTRRKVDAIRRKMKKSQREERAAFELLENDLQASGGDPSEIDRMQSEIALARQMMERDYDAKKSEMEKAQMQLESLQLEMDRVRMSGVRGVLGLRTCVWQECLVCVAGGRAQGQCHVHAH